MNKKVRLIIIVIVLGVLLLRYCSPAGKSYIIFGRYEASPYHYEPYSLMYKVDRNNLKRDKRGAYYWEVHKTGKYKFKGTKMSDKLHAAVKDLLDEIPPELFEETLPSVEKVYRYQDGLYLEVVKDGKVVKTAIDYEYELHKIQDEEIHKFLKKIEAKLTKVLDNPVKPNPYSDRKNK